MLKTCFPWVSNMMIENLVNSSGLELINISINSKVSQHHLHASKITYTSLIYATQIQEVSHPCEDYTPGMKITIFAQSGEHEGPHPCEGRARKKEGRIPCESGDPDTHNP